MTDLPVTDGLVLDLDATKLGLNDLDPVAEWPDSSGAGNDAIQTTEAAQPTYRTDVLNGQPVVRFDGTDDYFALTQLLSGATDATVFTIIRLASVSVDQWVLGQWDPNAFLGLPA